MTKLKKKKASVGHFSFPRSSIAEALCEIHFKTSASFSEASFKKIKAILSTTYPDAAERRMKQYHTEIKETGISVDEKSIPHWVFKHEQRNHIIQVFPGILSVNELQPYPGWEVFFKDLSFAWTSVEKIFSALEVDRVGLRYINLIPKNHVNEPLSVWLKPNRYYPDGILDSYKILTSRCEYNIDENRKLVVTVGESSKQGQPSTFIFDIEMLSKLPHKAQWTDIQKETEALHDVIWEIFSSSITKKYEAFLRNEKL